MNEVVDDDEDEDEDEDEDNDEEEEDVADPEIENFPKC